MFVAEIRWDWFKLARRWTPWILLVIFILMSELSVWGTFFAYQNLRETGGSIPVLAPSGRRPVAVNCKDVLAGNVASLPPEVSPDLVPSLQAQCRDIDARLNQQLSPLYRAFTLPGSITESLNLDVSVALILLAILTASHFGAEYGWGTVRPNLSRGTGRLQFVASRLILLFLLAAAALLVVTTATIVSSTVAANLATPPGPAAAGSTWPQALVALGKGWSACIPIISLAAFATILTRSTAAGMAIAIGYYLGEQIVVAILSGPFHWFATVAQILPAQNIGAWAGLSFFGQDQASIGSVHAFLVLVAYTIALSAGSFSLFERRDVAGASGG